MAKDIGHSVFSLNIIYVLSEVHMNLPNRLSFQQNHVAEHQTSLKWPVLLNIPITILHFLFNRGEEQVEAVALVELQQVRLVVGIDDKVTATRLVISRSEPIYNKVYNLLAEVESLIL